MRVGESQKEVRGLPMALKVKEGSRKAQGMSTWLFVLVLGALGSPAGEVRADDKQACLDAYALGQRLQRAEEFIEARRQLRTCASSTCPAFVQADCARWLSEVEAAIPSVVLSARTPDGRDVIKVEVTMDGRSLLDHLDGKSVELDPGVHELVFKSDGFRPEQREVVIKTAEQNRKVEVVLHPLASATEPASGRDTPKTQRDGAIPVSTYAIGALGLLGWTGFTYFAIEHKGQIDDLEACEPTCPTSDVNDASATRTFAFASLAVGVAATGITVYLVVDGSEPEPTPDVSVSVMPYSNGAAATLGGSF